MAGTTRVTMKTLSLLQPWASLMVTQWPSGRFCKMIETRSWRTSYRGPIAIHSSAGMKKEQTALAITEPFKQALAGRATWPLPKGRILGIGRLTGCVSTCVARLSWLQSFCATSIEEALAEAQFGDYGAGRFAWVIEDMHRLKEPVPVKGMLGLWDWMPNEEANEIRGKMKP